MGREFIDLFERWAESYDTTVSGQDEEYRDVFKGYSHILTSVAHASVGNVLEFGVGTGNLTAILLDKGLSVTGVEPSKAMRDKAAERFPKLTLLDGDFIDFPELDDSVQTIVSTYAFHHLTDTEKEVAIRKYSQLLSENDKIVFADTAFQNEDAMKQMHEKVKSKGYLNLLQDLQTEYYTTIPVLEELFKKNGFEVAFTQLNDFVWLIEAVKK
ncbi:class I SAM-dependent DNA methyltransferase [Guptibacillus algicola]|uniref:class I SAM-dependent DNA methyltransferase n=1 Tax=Guptibacillus algicola TaxID=225844 RepID=UPI001CD6F27F|nr:class I SAM-dependent methyltransferase [Alkalihalobacillus algicola]MCA0986150.1 class I SAM-dependent methyltransferase [Alkalihalobacillus algicola]